MVAGVKMRDMVGDHPDDYNELMQLDNTNFVLDEGRFRNTQQSAFTKKSSLLDSGGKRDIAH